MQAHPDPLFRLKAEFTDDVWGVDLKRGCVNPPKWIAPVDWMHVDVTWRRIDARSY